MVSPITPDSILFGERPPLTVTTGTQPAPMMTISFILVLTAETNSHGLSVELSTGSVTRRFRCVPSDTRRSRQRALDHSSAQYRRALRHSGKVNEREIKLRPVRVGKMRHEIKIRTNLQEPACLSCHALAQPTTTWETRAHRSLRRTQPHARRAEFS